jgi:hypothetical protein
VSVAPRHADGSKLTDPVGLWAADVCAAIATKMPAGIDSECVTTPLPFAWSVFEHVSWRFDSQQETVPMSLILPGQPDQMRAALPEERTMQSIMNGKLKGTCYHADL